MPLTSKGKKIKRAMRKQYGKNRGEGVFHASANKGTISGVEKGGRRRRRSGAAASLRSRGARF